MKHSPQKGVETEVGSQDLVVEYVKKVLQEAVSADPQTMAICKHVPWTRKQVLMLGVVIHVKIWWILQGYGRFSADEWDIQFSDFQGVHPLGDQYGWLNGWTTLHRSWWFGYRVL